MSSKQLFLLHLALISCLLFCTVSAESYKCLTNKDTKFEAQQNDLIIALQVTNRATHQLMTRIFDIFLSDVLNYKNIRIVPIHFKNATDPYNSWYTLDNVRSYKEFHDISAINLEVWLQHGIPRMPEYILDAGVSITPGRFGWFVPKSQVLNLDENFSSLHYKIFQNINNTHYKHYLMDNNITDLLISRVVEEYRNPKCDHRICATLLAEFKNDSYFIESHLKDSYLNVIWLGSRFQETIEELTEIYQTQYPLGQRRFIVLHWTPSAAIVESKFNQIILPRCEEFKYLQESFCRYDLTPIMKYYEKTLESDSQVMHALRYFLIRDLDLAYFQKELRQRRNQSQDIEQIYNEIACDWMKTNRNVYSTWIKKAETPKVIAIGGIFPFNVTDRGHLNIVKAAEIAEQAINKNNSILSGYKFKVMKNDGHCKSDMVMKAFIHYYNTNSIMGVLGPACSETVEPIAGLSKHLKMPVISYSADGESFVDRQSYPYFFRTIGSHSQYVNAYMELMARLGWNRVSTLTEDAHPYADYMSYLESSLKLNNFTLAFNRKFLPNASAEDMNEHLSKLKEAHSKIIIAELHGDNAAVAICEAVHLEMTHARDYVWFLPSWLPKDFKTWEQKVNYRCTAEQMRNAIEGHLSLRHTPFAQPEQVMQEGITVKSWLNAYRSKYGNYSNYVGFVYDAVWAYALAAHRLIQSDRYAVNKLGSRETVNELTRLLWETDFQGLSGRVSFGRGEFGGSRIMDMDILQWRNVSYLEVGKFRPKVEGTGSELHVSGGNLSFDANKVFPGKVPEDGRYDCRYSGLARGLKISCDLATMVVSICICLAIIFCMSFVSFYFWKQRYNRKVRHSAQIMKMFGIDLITPSRNKTNTLDKWQIPKSNVVINRKLGEGAFGTVYGGEAQLASGDWTAVAVKTLKSGASTEDRLDFLAEAEAMKKFNHKNIVKLVAVCLQEEPVYTIMEFMLYGDLKTYLLARRNMVTEKITDDSDISPKRLTMYALDVARGLSYLAEQKYVHRDIACRNCLVNAQRVIKIGDFGMARPTSESDYYCFNRKGVRKLFPVRWMPPETLSLGLFTSASDIWSFGVVLYEVITFGSYPYQGLTNNQVLDHVKNGNTLRIPAGVKPPLEGLLKACWSQEASKRPSALEVIDYISCYPRLLTPSLDCPGTAVQLPETESDEMELLPPGRQSSPLTQESTLYTLPSENSAGSIQEFQFPNPANVTEPATVAASIPQSNTESFSPTTPDGYSIMSPLLMHQQNARQ